MKKLKLMPLVLGGAMIAGCMSLEERLASNDARVRRYAEYELVQQAYRNGTQQDRLAAIGRVSDQELLFGLAMKSKDNTAKEGAAAVQKLTDANQVLQIAKTSAVGDVGVAALAKVSDASSYVDIAQTAKAPAVRAAAYEKIDDQEKLLSVVQMTKDKAIKLSAIKRVNDKEKLLPIVFASTATAAPTARPAKRDLNAEKRKMAEKMNMEKRMMAEKMSKGKKANGEKDAPAASAQVEVAQVDAELVDAFIANCSQEDVLIKMVKTYGARLSSVQCAALTKKSENAELKELIASVADLKTVERIRVADPDDYKTLLDSIANVKIKNSACAEIMLKGLEVESTYHAAEKYGYAKVHFYEALFSSRRDNCIMKDYIGFLSDRQLSDIVLSGKVDETDFYKDNDSHVFCFRQSVLAAMSISSAMKLFPKMLALRDNNPKESHYRYEGICDEFEYRFERDMPSDQKLLVDFINGTNGKVLKEETVKAIYKAVSSPEAAEAFLNRQDITTVKGVMGENWQSERVLPWMASLMLKVSQGEKERVLSEAQKELARNKDAVRIGPFYIGMPYYEATLVAEKEGLYTKDGGLIALYFANGELKRDEVAEIAKDWKKNLRVKKIVYTTKAALKYLDCEDATVLQQAIKQCVKKESGKANSFDYAGEIKHNVQVESSRKIDLFSPTGTRLDFDSEIWETYTNTRLGVKLTHGEKNGTLILESL